MTAELIHGTEAFESLAAEWDTLAGQSMTDTPFQSLAYQRSWWRHLAPQGATLHTVAVRGDSGDLLGIACLFALDGTLHFNGCIEETDYLDLIAPAGHAAAVWSQVLDCLAAAPEPVWTALDLCNIPAASVSRTALREQALARGFAIDESVIEACPIITLPDTFDAYLASLDSKERRETTRKLRRAEAADVVIHQVGPDEDIDAAVDRFLTLLQKSTFEKRDWLNEGRRAHFHETARAAMSAGTLQLLFAEVDGRPAAGLFNFDHGDRIWVYNSGLDPESFSGLSLGVVLTAAAIERAIAAGRRDFDFLRGREEYKYRFGAVDTEVYRLHLARPRIAGTL
jgi:CelD/BcsL family acetyltransferase involved in cellulose biosynthesis